MAHKTTGFGAQTVTAGDPELSISVTGFGAQVVVNEAPVGPVLRGPNGGVLRGPNGGILRP